MNKRKFLSSCVQWLICILAISGCNSQPNNRIVIGSKNFTEQRILGELLAQYIESNSDLKVDRRLDLGGTFVCHQALSAGQIDAYVEYTGTAFTAILKNNPIKDPHQVYERVKQEYQEKFKLSWMPNLGFNNTFAIIVRGEDARKLNIKTISQSAKFTPNWKAGFGYEFIERKDGFQGLSKTYGLKFAEAPRVMDLGLMYRALKEKQVDFVAGNSTDGTIDRLDLAILKDDRLYFPPYEAAPVVRQETLQKYPQLQILFYQLSGSISDLDMRRLNYQVEGEGRDIKQVVNKFLQSKGLIKKEAKS